MIFKHPVPHIAEAVMQATTTDTPIWARVIGCTLAVAIAVMVLLCGWEQSKINAVLGESEERFRVNHPKGLECADGSRLMPLPLLGERAPRYVGRHRTQPVPRPAWRPQLGMPGAPVPAPA
jgi:hypothetical protein